MPLTGRENGKRKAVSRRGGENMAITEHKQRPTQLTGSRGLLFIYDDDAAIAPSRRVANPNKRRA